MQMHSLNGEEYGAEQTTDKAHSELASLGGLLSGGKGGGTFADISQEWERVCHGRRAKKARMTTVHVAGVGQVRSFATARAIQSWNAV